MTQASADVTLAGQHLSLRADRSVWVHATPHVALHADGRWDAEPDTLLVADVHLGKAHQYRAHGLPLGEAVTEGSNARTLARLLHALRETGASRLVVLGDLFHGPAVGDSIAQLKATLDTWRAGLALRGLAAQLVVIGGNHDRGAALDLSALSSTGSADADADADADAGVEPLALTVLPEHAVFWLGHLALTHHPEPVADAGYTLAGHLHPCVHLPGRARDRLRLPCFWLGSPQQRPVGVLPAFGEFTGMHPVLSQPGDQVWAVAGEHLHALPG